jgi:hypothetical protein
MKTSTSITRLFCCAVLLAGICFGGSARAQNYYEEVQRTFYGGLVAGGNFATIDNDNFTKYNKIGLNVGAIVYAQLAEHLAMSMEILYSQKGRKTTDLTQTGIPGVNFTYIYDQLNYAEVPIMVNYFDKDKSHFGLGLSYGRLISANEILYTDPVIALNPNDYHFKKDDIEFLASAQLHIWQRIFLNIRFQYSIFAIRSKVPTGFDPPEQNNNLFALRLMYLAR